MIKSATVVNYLGESLKLVLSDPKETGIKILGITGLGPPKATINTSKVSTVDGVNYNSATVDGRNIVFETELLALPTVEEVRIKTYKYFPIKKPVTLIFETETRVAAITGYVESNSPDLFSEAPTAQISIMCTDAYFYDASDNGVLTTLFYNVEAGFEFPFSNESLTEKLIEFGKVQTRLDREIVYNGETDVGMTVTINALGTVGDVIVYNTENNQAMRISSAKLKTMTGSGITVGDRIIVNTTRGNKTVLLYRDGKLYNIRNALERNSNWLYLVKGVNKIAYSASAGVNNLQITVENQILYEGL
jgi:hypothetical protein